MARDQNELSIGIDDHKTVQEGFTDTASALLYRGHMTVLAWNQKPKSLPGLPTWVPDLTLPIRDSHGEDRHYILFSAAGPESHPLLPETFPPFKSPSQGMQEPLTIHCYKVDVVATVGSKLQRDGPDKNEYAAVNTFFDEIEHFAKERPPLAAAGKSLRQTPQRWAEAHWRIPTADQSVGGSRSRAMPALRDTFLQARKIIAMLAGAGPESVDAVLKSIDNINVSGAYLTALKYQDGRRPFISKDGYVGLAPGDARPGDILAVVKGASVPYVFRDRGERRDFWIRERWDLVGEAYIDGLMDGEVPANAAAKISLAGIF